MRAEDRAYIESRRRQVRSWPWAAGVLALVLLACFIALYMNVPLFVSPSMVLALVSSPEPSVALLSQLAVFGNMAILVVFLMIAALLVIASVAMWNEYRLLRILDAVSPPAVVADDVDTGGQNDAPENTSAEDVATQSSNDATRDDKSV